MMRNSAGGDCRVTCGQTSPAEPFQAVDIRHGSQNADEGTCPGKALTPCPSPILLGTAGGRGESLQPPRRLLSAPRCLLSAPCCLLPAPCCLLPAPCCLLPAPRSLLSAPCCLLPAACSLLPAPCSLLPAPCCLRVEVLQVDSIGNGVRLCVGMKLAEQGGLGFAHQRNGPGRSSRACSKAATHRDSSW